MLLPVLHMEITILCISKEKKTAMVLVEAGLHSTWQFGNAKELHFNYNI